MNTKLVVLLSVVLVVAAAGYGVWYFFMPRQVNKFYMKMPNGEVLEFKRAPRMSPDVKKNILAAELEGKIDLIPESGLKGAPTRLVMITNQGEMINLVNPLIVNKLRFQYVGKVVKLKGYWDGEVPFRGGKFRSMFAEEIEK